MSVSETDRRAYCKTAHTMFVQAGLTSEQAAGICANIVAESNFDPTAIGIDGSKSGRHGVGGGLAGFYYYGAASDLFKFVYGGHGKEQLDILNSKVEPYWNGVPCSAEVRRKLSAAGFSWPISFGDQVKYLISKTNASGHGGGVRKCKSAKDACIVWEKEFERSAAGNGAGRWAAHGNWVISAVNDPSLALVEDGPIMVYSTPRNKQDDNILIQTIAFCKKQLLYEALESAGVRFDLPNEKEDILNNAMYDFGGTESSISESIVLNNMCNPFGGSDTGFGGTSLKSDDYNINIGPIPAPYPGQFSPKAGVRNGNALWNGRQPTINDSTTPVPANSGARGTPPTWVKNQIVSCKLPNGETIQIHKALTQSITNIVSACLKAGYPINIGGNAFSFRRCNNGKLNQPLSNHGCGGAVDVWAAQNPFVHGGRPLSSGDTKTRYRTRNHPVVQIFRKYGWGWGGEYGDYMHFSINDGH